MLLQSRACEREERESRAPSSLLLLKHHRTSSSTSSPPELLTMESLLTDTRLPEEIQAFKATAELLATLKQRFPNSYIPPVEERHRRPTLVNVRPLSSLPAAHQSHS